MTAPVVAPFAVDKVPPKRLSMSFLRAAEGCLRRAHLDREASIPLDGDALIGTLFHEAAAAIAFACVMRGEKRPTVDGAVAIARVTLRRPERIGPLPRAAWTTVLDLVERWARAPRTVFHPGEVFEVLSVHGLAGRPLSARLDRYRVDGRTLHIVDYKTGWADPAHGLTIQGEIYAWHGFMREPHVDVVAYGEEHIRSGMQAGPFELTRDDVFGPAGIEEFLLDAIARLDHAYRSPDPLPATPGSACSSPSRCQHATTCPIPKWAREDTTVETREDAVALFEALLVSEQQRAAHGKAIRGWLDATGERALQHGGEEIGRALQPGSSLDKKALAAALEQSGADVQINDYVKATNPSFGRRKAKGA